jgi:hypothetical protein
MLAPSIANPENSWSIARPRQTAETMPQGTPISVAIAIEKRVRNSVGSARSHSACVTGRCRKIDWPRLPRASSFNQ